MLTQLFGSEGLAIIYGLGSAAVWGTGDFSGGLSTKRNPVLTVLVFSQIVGSLLLLGFTLWTGTPFPGVNDLLRGAVAGISGSMGIVFLYKGLAAGRMGLVAPLAAVFMTVLPVCVGIFNQGTPEFPVLVGFVLAMAAVWLVSGGRSSGSGISRLELVCALGAGAGFGGFLACIGQLEGSSALWPILAARFTSIPLFSCAVLAKGLGFVPKRKTIPLVAAAGICDTAGNCLFALASSSGRLDIAAVLASMAPAMTVLLALVFLGERLSIRQWTGVGLALFALVLIA